jgi:hypothetical protein
MPSSDSGNEEGFVIEPLSGTVYTGEGCWGAPLRPNDDDKSWTRKSGSFNQFKLIFVDSEKIELRTIKVDNADSVGEVSNTNPFTLPANLDVFTPAPGEDVVTIYKDPPLSVSEALLNEIKIYTNEAEQKIIVEGYLPNSTIFNLYNIQGKIIISQRLDSYYKSFSVDVSQLNPAIYVIELKSTSSEKRIKKLIIN